MTVEGIKRRLKLFDQYDHTINRLIEELPAFQKSSKGFIRQKTESIKLYGLAFNFAWTLRNDIQLCLKYKEEVENSLLDERFDINQKYSDKIEQEVDEMIPYLENIIDTWDVNIEDSQKVEISIDKDSEKLLSDNKYLLDLSKDLTKNGKKILSLLCVYLRYISDQLKDIKTLRANLDDNKYRFLFEKEFKEYLLTDEWSDQKSDFIERTIKNRYHGKEPTKEQLDELLSTEIEKIEGMSDRFGSIVPYLEDYPKLSRQIVNRNLETSIRTPILDLFLRLGRKLLIEKWKLQLESEELCYVPVEIETVEVTYSERYNERICKRTMPKILEIYKDRNAMDWVCFYHVLVYYGYIGCDDFNEFNRWLTQVAGREIISVGNARKIKLSYWADKAKKRWVKEDALKEKNTQQQETKFRDYTLLCDEIRDIINKG